MGFHADEDQGAKVLTLAIDARPVSLGTSSTSNQVARSKLAFEQNQPAHQLDFFESQVDITDFLQDVNSPTWVVKICRLDPSFEDLILVSHYIFYPYPFCQIIVYVFLDLLSVYVLSHYMLSRHTFCTLYFLS